MTSVDVRIFRNIGSTESILFFIHGTTDQLVSLIEYPWIWELLVPTFFAILGAAGIAQVYWTRNPGYEILIKFKVQGVEKNRRF